MRNFTKINCFEVGLLSFSKWPLPISYWTLTDRVASFDGLSLVSKQSSSSSWSTTFQKYQAASARSPTYYYSKVSMAHQNITLNHQSAIIKYVIMLASPERCNILYQCIIVQCTKSNIFRVGESFNFVTDWSWI